MAVDVAPAPRRSSGSGQTIILIVVVAIVLAVASAILFPVKLQPVELSGRVAFTIAGFPIYNTWLSAWLTIILWALIFGLVTRNLKLVPGRVQSLCEAVIEILFGFATNMAGERKGRQMFPLYATIFLFVLFNNWQELLPGFTNGTLFVSHGEEAVPLFRAASADLNTTIALALISVIYTQWFSIRSIGVGDWLARYFNVRGGPMGLYVSILELIGELAHIISFSFRLFGNIFAGDVLLSVIPFLIPWVIVLPFLFLELFVGVIQAFIFATLTLVFTQMASTTHGHHGGEEVVASH